MKSICLWFRMHVKCIMRNLVSAQIPTELMSWPLHSIYNSINIKILIYFTVILFYNINFISHHFTFVAFSYGLNVVHTINLHFHKYQIYTHYEMKQILLYSAENITN